MRLISIIAIFAFLASASVFAADEIEITSGAYYQLGKYNGSPILWRTVVMQIGNPEMGNGAEVFTLDVAPTLKDDRTLVPLRAVSEAFDCKVEWIEELNRAVIDPPQPEDSDEGHWQSDWDIAINGKGKK